MPSELLASVYIFSAVTLAIFYYHFYSYLNDVKFCFNPLDLK